MDTIHVQLCVESERFRRDLKRISLPTDTGDMSALQVSPFHVINTIEIDIYLLTYLLNTQSTGFRGEYGKPWEPLNTIHLEWWTRCYSALERRVNDRPTFDPVTPRWPHCRTVGSDRFAPLNCPWSDLLTLPNMERAWHMVIMEATGRTRAKNCTREPCILAGDVYPI